MRSVRVRYRAQALRDLRSIYAYLVERNPRAAEDTTRRIRAAARQLGQFPYLGRAGAGAGTREWKVSRAPYIIVYAIDERAEELVILGVFHGAQLRPGQEGAGGTD
jgi:toxin ParE1/3/4